MNQNVLPEEINIQQSYKVSLNSISPIPCQNFLVRYAGVTFLIHLDSGATVSFVRLDWALKLKLKILPNGQLASLADKKTQIQSIGEIDILVIVDNEFVLRLRALVVKNLQVDCYAGTKRY